MDSTDHVQQAAFQQRIARISQARYGVPEQAVRQNYMENLAYPLSFIGAALIGALSVFAARYIRFQLGAGSIAGEGADTLMIMDVVAASAAGLFLKMIFRIRSQHYKSAQTVGVLAMVALMHNAVHSAPRVFSMVFSPEWVEQVQTSTEPKTAIFAGYMIPLSGAPAGADGAENAGSGSDGPRFIVLQNGG
jgi:hypothetical protein